MQKSMYGGLPTISWVPYGDARDALKGRLDLTFIRPGKDQLPAIEAGRAPDRVGVFFCDADSGLRAGDRIVCIAGPITGTFDVRVIPDVAQGFSTGHHIEVQVIETSQQLDNIFPGTE